MWTLASAGLLFAVGLIALELAAARIPEQRAELEELIHHETGLEVSFSRLQVSWGWYGPEVVLETVRLGDPELGDTLLRARRLIVSLDAWRMVRSGHLEAGRITLVNPDIDLKPLRATAPAAAGAANPAGAARATMLADGARILSRWRGGRIDIEGGTLRWPLPASGAAVTVGIRSIQLRRLGSTWSADALLLPSADMGAGAHLALTMTGDPAQPQTLSGTLELQGERLQLSGWRALVADTAASPYVPLAGTGTFELRAKFGRGQWLSADGSVRARTLTWGTAGSDTAQLRIDRLRGTWRLARRGEEWHLNVDGLQLADASAPPATVRLDVAANAAWVRGRIEHAPLSTLARLAHCYASQLPLASVEVSGEARELVFDYDARRAAGARLLTSAQLADLALGAPDGSLMLSRLSARLASADTRVVADLEATDAQLALAGDEPATLGGFTLAARVAIGVAGKGWQIEGDAVEARRADMTVLASGTVSAATSAAVPQLSAHLALKDTDVNVITQLLGTRLLASVESAPANFSAGRIDSAQFELQGPLDARLPWPRAARVFRGAVQLRAASLTGLDPWPDTRELDARIDFDGTRVRAAIERGESGTFRLDGAHAEWDSARAAPLHFAGRFSGGAQQALQWLRDHPQLSAFAPGVGSVDLRGDTLIDIDVTVPVAGAGVQATPRTRIIALLDGVELRPLTGVPPITALRGTLGFSGGHLQHSTLTGQWLGGPVTLGIGERREHARTVLSISGRGMLAVRQALTAAGGSAADSRLDGDADWSALLTLAPDSAADAAGWSVRADSNLAGVLSALPEPFAKPQSAVLPLHVELAGGAERGQLHVSLGERLRAVAALERTGDMWRIERGAVSLSATAPGLPAQAVIMLDGRLSRLDLGAYLALWRQAGRDAALPALRARLSAAQLLIGERSYAEANVLADAAGGGGALQFESADIAGDAHWPALDADAQPALLHLVSFNLTQPGDAALGSALPAALGPLAHLTIDDLKWQGRSLGRFGATFAARADTLEIADLQLNGGSGQLAGTVHCTRELCRSSLGATSSDAAAALATVGLRPELEAEAGRLQAELEWQPQAPQPLATLGGHLHMQFDEGTARVAATGAQAAPFPLLMVPALMAGMELMSHEGNTTQLRFARLVADFELHDGEARTGDLHLDGDAEILLRGRVGLLARDYDAEALILRGEERLPAAVRRLGPTPKVVAAWLALRDLVGGSGSGRSQTALRLHGTWDDPIVAPAQ